MWKKKSVYWLIVATAAGINCLPVAADDAAPDKVSSDAVPDKVPSAAAVQAALQSGVPMSSNTIADIAQAVAPAVVNIDVQEEVMGRVVTMPAFESMFGNMAPEDMPPMFRQFFGQLNPGLQPAPGQKVPPGQKQKIAVRQDTGSGFIIRPNGYILTNAHVVRGASKIKVTLNDKRVLEGKVVGTDGFSDLAVVKVDADNLPIANMGTSATVRPGEFVIAIGSPLELDHTVTFGIISAVGRSVQDVNGNINFIQTDAAINPGNSGGPLLNLKGEVIGVNTAIRRDAQNIGFSIPIDIAKTVSSELIEHKLVQRPWLGISMAPLESKSAQALGLPPTTKGVYISRILRKSPASASHLREGDIIEKIDGRSVEQPQEVRDIVTAHKVQDTLHFMVLRDNTLTAVEVNIGQYPNDTADRGEEPEEN